MHYLYWEDYMLVDPRHQIKETDLEDYKSFVIKIVFLLGLGTVVAFVCSFVV